MRRTTPDGCSQSDSRRSFSKSLWTSLIVMAAVISSSRMSGQFSRALSNLEACAAVTLAVLISLLAYVLYWSTGRSHREYQPLILVGVVTLVPPFALGLALQPNPSTVAISYLVSLFFLAALALFALGEMVLAAPVSHNRESHLSLPSENGSSLIQNSESELIMKGEAFCPQSDPKDDPHVTQWMKRSVSEEFQERIEGEITVVMTNGQKLSVVHVPFVPPLAARPQIECRGDNDSQVRFKVASINSYGIRIEIRRSGSNTAATSIRLCFTATTSAAQYEAA